MKATEIKFRAWDEQGKFMHPPMTLSEIFAIGKEQELGVTKETRSKISESLKLYNQQPKP